jgi:hypothetical protein
MCRENKFQGQSECVSAHSDAATGPAWHALRCAHTETYTNTHTHTHTHTHTAKLIARVTPVAVKGYICQCRRQQLTEHGCLRAPLRFFTTRFFFRPPLKRAKAHTSWFSRWVRVVSVRVCLCLRLRQRLGRRQSATGVGRLLLTVRSCFSVPELRLIPERSAQAGARCHALWRNPPRDAPGSGNSRHPRHLSAERKGTKALLDGTARCSLRALRHARHPAPAAGPVLSDSKSCPA